MDFSDGAGQKSSSDLIPAGQLAWAIINVRGVKASGSGGQYLDVELTLDDGQPFGRRKLWDMIGDPHFAGNSDAYRQMGRVAIARILETGRGAGPANPAGYSLGNYQELSGLRVAVKIGVEKGGAGFEDKNRVSDYLTPNPSSGGGHKGYVALTEGKHNLTAAPAAKAPPANGFGGGAATGGQGGGGGFGQGGGQANGGFQAQPASAGQGGASTAANQPSGGFAAPANPHSEPAPGGWLAQAQTQQ